MKKANATKLTVRREIIRALSTLDLANVVGGETATATTVTCRANCTTDTLKPIAR